MSVLINFKICDNAKECNGIAVCKTGALSWDEKKKTIVIDNKKCINCMKCESACMVNAIKVARNEQEYRKIKKEFDEDPRKGSDLFVDRYGAQPIHPAFLIDEDKFESEVEDSVRITAAELFSDDSIMCLLKSVPIKDIIGDVKYRKVKITTDKLKNKYKIKELPSLLFFKDGKFIGKIEGFFSEDRKEEIKQKINKILEK